MNYEIKCIKCQSSTTNPLDYRCRCGSPFEVHVKIDFSKNMIKKNNYTVFRYSEFFPYLNKEQNISLGEGWTPLIKYDKKISFKLDFLNPTGSFKDRGSATLISSIWKPIKDVNGYISEDSSGNAGASIAAYAAKAGLKSKIYVPTAVSGQKFNQLLFYGANVKRVTGERSKVTAEAQKPEKSKFYIGHIWHPIFRDGIRTLTYELAEQLQWKLPDYVYLPASAGTLLLGFINGLEHLMECGIIHEFPTIIACQTQQVSPLYHKLKNLPYIPPEKIISIADALVSINPPLLGLMVKKMRNMAGEAEVLDDTQIYKSFVELAKNGFFVEPSSAVAYAAYKKHIENGKVSKNENTVVILTGIGLKTKLRP